MDRKIKFDRISEVFLLLSFLFVALRIFYDYQMGGHPWNQGDWLINNSAGDIRRGHLGSFLLMVSDFSGLSPLVVVSIIQLCFLLLLYFNFYAVLKKIRDSSLRVFLSTSPAIFSVFWVAHPAAGLRKEIIIFSALSLCVVGILRQSWGRFWLGFFILIIGFFSHEGLVLFLSIFLALIFFEQNFLRMAQKITLAVVASVAAGVALAYAMSNRTGNAEAICGSLVVRGLDPLICDGAIDWLQYDTAYAFGTISFDWGSLSGFFVAYLLAIVPFLYLSWISVARARFLGLLIISGLVFLPLYYLAIDWGRWMSFHIFSLTLAWAFMLARDSVEFRGRPRLCFVAGYAGCSLFVSPNLFPGITWGGAIFNVFEDFLKAASRLF